MKKRISKGVPVLFVLALVLLAFSAVGSASAALTYYNEDYKARVSASTMDVVVSENGIPAEDGKLLTALGGGASDSSVDGQAAADGKAEPVVPGKAYQEVLTVTNTGNIDVYARVVIRRYWLDKNGKKDTALSPELIELKPSADSGWVLDPGASTAERLVYYYTNILPAKNKENPDAVTTSTPISESVRISPEVAKKISVKSKGDGTVETVYDYDGYSFCLEADVETVQSHNAADAIKSAWGVDVKVSDGKLTLPASAGSGN